MILINLGEAAGYLPDLPVPDARSYDVLIDRWPYPAPEFPTVKLAEAWLEAKAEELRELSRDERRSHEEKMALIEAAIWIRRSASVIHWAMLSEERGSLADPPSQDGPF